jgi:cyanophycin synthetase
VQYLLHRAATLCTRVARAVVRRVRKRAPVESTLQVHNRLFLAAAGNIGLEAKPLDANMVVVSDGSRRLFVSNTNFSFESLTAYWICGDKSLSSSLLEQAGLPVPLLRRVRGHDARRALDLFEAFSGPVVVKPNQGANATGVTVNVTSRRDFVAAYFRAIDHCPDAVIEQFVTGNHWRITLLDDELISALQRIPARVVGDGEQSVLELIERYNAQIGKRNGFPAAKPIVVNVSARRDLAAQGYTLASVPQKDESVAVHFACNSALGGRTLDVTARVDRGFIDAAVQAARTLGAKLAGVDVIASDITRPPEHGKYFINEVNTTPDLMLANYDIHCASSSVSYAEQVLRLAFASDHLLCGERVAESSRFAA